MNKSSIKAEGGLRTKGMFNKRSEPGKLLVSIVTVVLNGERTLERTIQSVINQTYDNIEYIIVDGGSSDGTIDIIKKYEKYLAYWTIGLVRGIYDQMNEGIDLASGDIICFLNSDDLFYDNNVLEVVTKEFKKDEKVGIVYGCTEYFSDFAGVKYIKGKKMNCLELWKGMSICHQSMLYRKQLFNVLGKYDTRFKIVADHEFLLRFLKRRGEHGYKDVFINNVISKYSIHGISAKKLFSTLKESKQVSDLYFDKTFYHKFYFKLQSARYVLRILVIKIGLWKYYCKLKFNFFTKLIFRKRNIEYY